MSTLYISDLNPFKFRYLTGPECIRYGYVAPENEPYPEMNPANGTQHSHYQPLLAYGENSAGDKMYVPIVAQVMYEHDNAAQFPVMLLEKMSGDVLAAGFDTANGAYHTFTFSDNINTSLPAVLPVDTNEPCRLRLLSIPGPNSANSIINSSYADGGTFDTTIAGAYVGTADNTAYHNTTDMRTGTGCMGVIVGVDPSFGYDANVILRMPNVQIPAGSFVKMSAWIKQPTANPMNSTGAVSFGIAAFSAWSPSGSPDGMILRITPTTGDLCTGQWQQVSTWIYAAQAMDVDIVAWAEPMEQLVEGGEIFVDDVEINVYDNIPTEAISEGFLLYSEERLNDMRLAVYGGWSHYTYGPFETNIGGIDWSGGTQFSICIPGTLTPQGRVASNEIINVNDGGLEGVGRNSYNRYTLKTPHLPTYLIDKFKRIASDCYPNFYVSKWRPDSTSMGQVKALPVFANDGGGVTSTDALNLYQALDEAEILIESETTSASQVE